MTAQWNGAAASKVAFWRVYPIQLPDTSPPALERFALAEVELPSTALVIRMVMLHIGRKAGEGELPAEYGRAYHFEPLDAPKDLALPGAEAVAFKAFAPLLLDLEDASAEDYAARLLRELDAELEARRHVGAAPIPRSLSRLYRQVPSIAECELRPAPRPQGAPLVFAAGSCRHPGVGFDRRRTDAALLGIAERSHGTEGVDLALMLGDQIYVDAAAGVLDGAERLEKYALRYDAAFSSPGFRAVASSVPTYMLADDHEVRDGWPNDTLPARDEFWDTPVEWAWRLYIAHQRWHGPERPRWASRPRVARPSFWYSFEHRGHPFFAFDARFERRPGGEHIVGREQIAAFKTWLRHVRRDEGAGRRAPHVPKFVLSGSVFAPGLDEFERRSERARRADNWQGFRGDQALAARLVAESGLQNVVFVSGDYHCAAIGTFAFAGVRGYTVVAPPLYAPYPFANALERDIAAEEKFPIGRGSAKAFGVQGFALVRARRERHAGAPEDWELDVELYRHSDPRTPARTGLLAGGAADWKTL